MPTDKEKSALSILVIQRALRAIAGYPKARLRGGTLRFVWAKDGNRRLSGYVDVEWNGGARPPQGKVAADGRPVREGPAGG